MKTYVADTHALIFYLSEPARLGSRARRAFADVRDGDDQVAGFVAVNQGKIDALFIHPAARRQGAGKRLLDHAVTAFGAAILDVNEQIGQAVGFYLHMGFEIVGRSELDGTGKPYPLLHMRRL